MKNRNHEGYQDPTACAAIRRAHRQHKRLKKRIHLVYRLEETNGFTEAAVQLH